MLMFFVSCNFKNIVVALPNKKAIGDVFEEIYKYFGTLCTPIQQICNMRISPIWFFYFLATESSLNFILIFGICSRHKTDFIQMSNVNY